MSRGSNDDDGDDASGDGNRKRRPESDASFIDVYNSTSDDCDDNLSLFLRKGVVPIKRRPLNGLRHHHVPLEDGTDKAARGIDISPAPTISDTSASPPPLLQLYYPRSFSKAAGMPPQVPTNDGARIHVDVDRLLTKAIYNMASFISRFVFCLYVVVSGLWLGK